jgi:DNA-directed RNA polymerase subunit RPC12/RpoP
MLDQADPWKHHRVLKRIGRVTAIFISMTVAFVALGLIDMRSRGFQMLMYCWMLFVLVMLTVTHEARCPRCGQRFYVKGLEFWQMTTRCLHCGQRKYAALGAIPKSEVG